MSKPLVFADLDYTSALEASRRQGKLLLLDATAVWCGPWQTSTRPCHAPAAHGNEDLLHRRWSTSVPVFSDRRSRR